MPTFEELARRAQGLTSLPIPMPLAVQWASDRVHELLGKRRVAILKRNLELSIPAPIGQGVASPAPGLVTITRGARIVTGDTAARAAWATLPASFPQGWFMRPKSAWYRIAGRSGQDIALESAFAENDVSAASYNLVQRYHQLPENVYQLDEGSFVLARIGLPLSFLQETELTLNYPHRWGLFTGGISIPRMVCEVEPGPGDVRQLEVYPYPNQSEMLTYTAYTLRDDFTYADPLPLGLEVQHILPGLLADFYSWAAAQPDLPADQKQLALNEKARTLTRWENAKEAGLQRLETNRSRGFIVLGPQSRTQRPTRGIRSAYDEIWSRP